MPFADRIILWLDPCGTQANIVGAKQFFCANLSFFAVIVKWTWIELIASFSTQCSATIA